MAAPLAQRYLAHAICEEKRRRLQLSAKMQATPSSAQTAGKSVALVPLARRAVTPSICVTPISPVFVRLFLFHLVRLL